MRSFDRDSKSSRANTPIIGDVRGLGVFFALELVVDRATKEPLAPYGASSPAMNDIVTASRNEALLIFTNFNRIHVVPPCTINDDEARDGLARLDRALVGRRSLLHGSCVTNEQRRRDVAALLRELGHEFVDHVPSDAQLDQLESQLVDDHCRDEERCPKCAHLLQRRNHQLLRRRFPRGGRRNHTSSSRTPWSRARRIRWV